MSFGCIQKTTASVHMCSLSVSFLIVPGFKVHAHCITSTSEEPQQRRCETRKSFVLAIEHTLQEIHIVDAQHVLSGSSLEILESQATSHEQSCQYALSLQRRSTI